VVLEYYLLSNEVTAFVIAPDKLEYYPGLCQIEEVISLKEHLDFQANKFNLGTNYIERRLPQLTEAFNHYLSKFYQLLLAPIIATLSAQELLIIPHGKLHSLPFHAFFDGESYLIEKFQVSYAPSFRVLLHCLEQKDRKPEKLLAVAVPDEKLSGVEVEVRSIAKLFPCAKVLVGEEATRKNLEEHLAWSDIVHLASHGHFRTDNPLFSMLKLYNEWLSVHDVMGLRFRPTLVTLSACQTGLAHPLRGDELLGLARGFMAAGAYSLVVSLWSVNDEVTTELMQRFYQNLVAGRGRAASLRQAMLQLCKESRYAHPYYWAPFIVIGQP
jgi:CHAT domain-containing protein